MTDKSVPTPAEIPDKYASEKYCCSGCAQKRRCHVCKDQTDLACSDCRIDLGVTVYVCSKKDCRDWHEQKCGQVQRERIAALTQENRERDREWWIRLGKFRKALDQAGLHGHYNIFQGHFQDEAGKWEALESKLEQLTQENQRLKEEHRVLDAAYTEDLKQCGEEQRDLKALLARIQEPVSDEERRRAIEYWKSLHPSSALIPIGEINGILNILASRASQEGK